MYGHAERSIGLRAAGIKDSVAKPMTIREKVTPFGATDFKPSAMNRNEAPQMRPGMTTRSQSVEETLWLDTDDVV
jgi:hypothetical protein